MRRTFDTINYVAMCILTMITLCACFFFTYKAIKNDNEFVVKCKSKGGVILDSHCYKIERININD